MLRRTFLALATGVAALGLGLGGVSAQELPKLKQKDKYKVGFAQTESNNPWRIAQTESMKAEAAKLGHQLVYTDAAGSAAIRCGRTGACSRGCLRRPRGAHVCHGRRRS